MWLHIRFDRCRFGLRRRTEVSALVLCAGPWSVSLDVVLVQPDDVSGGTVDRVISLINGDGLGKALLDDYEWTAISVIAGQVRP